MPRSAAAVTVVTTEAELLAGVGSSAAEVMVAELVTVPPAEGLTVMVMVPVALLARLEMLQVTIPLSCEADPKGLTAEMKEDPAGITSVTVTPVAAEGPRLVM